MNRYEILDGLPPYGPMYVSVTGDGEPYASEGFVVRFFKNDGTTWVANFKPGYGGLNEVISLPDTDNLLVIAGGDCYLMNRDSDRPIGMFGGDFTELFHNPDGRVVLGDNLGLTIVEPDGSHWDSKRISWDGLKDISLKNNTVTGLAYDVMTRSAEWLPFSYNIDTRLLEGGSYYDFIPVKKPWWKLW